MALMFPIVMLIINGSSVALIWFGGNRIASGQMTIGSLIAFLTYFTLILTAVMMATFVAIMAPRAAVCADRIVEVLDTKTSVAVAEAPIRDLPSLGTVEFRNVTFGYPGAAEPVLVNISFVTKPGEITA